MNKTERLFLSRLLPSPHNTLTPHTPLQEFPMHTNMVLPFLAIFMASVLPVSGFVQSFTPTSEMTFEWSLSSDGNTMSISLICDFDKWCSVAFGSSMSDADTITCSTTTPGSCEDAHSTGLFQPPRDAVQNLNSITSTTSNGKTTYTMTRLMNTGDSVDRVLVLGTTPIIWGIGPNLDIRTTHTKKSGATILLTINEPPATPPPSNSVWVRGCGGARILSENEMTIDYEMGSLGADEAVQFTVAITGTYNYGSIGFRTTGDEMQNYDILAWDLSQDNIVDYNIMTVPEAAPSGVDGQQDGVFVSRTGRTVVFRRRLSTGDAHDYVLQSGRQFELGWAVGYGSPNDGTWTEHPEADDADVTLNACPPTPSPPVTSAPTASPPTPMPPTPPAPGQSGTGATPGSQFFRPNQDMSFEWSMSTDGTTLLMTLDCISTKWCSIGFGASMSDADTITCSTTTPGSCEDAHSTGLFQPPRDAVQNLNNVNAVTANGRTVFTMTRLMNTGDSVDKVLVQGTAPLIWGVGVGEDIRLTHATKGATTILLSTNVAPATPAPPTAATQPAPAPSPPTPMPPTPPAPGQSGTGAAPGSQFFRPNQDMSFEWSMSTDGTTLLMTLDCISTKWCSIGFGASMSDADTITCSTTTPGSCEDAHSTGLFQPPRDAVQNLNNVNAVTANGRTVFTMTRLMNTGDSVDKVLVQGTAPLIWGVGVGEDIRLTHATKGATTILLSTNVAPATPAPPTPAPVVGQAGPTYSVVFAPEYSMTWSIAGDVITYVFTCSPGLWCAFGFGTSMADADTYTCSQSSCFDGHCSGYVVQVQDVLNDVLSYSIVGATDYTFSRKVDTMDAVDTVIVNQMQDVIWAYGPYTAGNLDTHEAGGSFGSLQINFFTGASASVGTNKLVYLILMFVLLLLPAMFVPLTKLCCRNAFEAPRFLGRMMVKGVGVYVVGVMWAGAAVCLYYANEDRLVWYKSLGHVAQLLLGMSFSMPSGRQSWIWICFGMPHEKVVFFHGIIGFLFMAVGTLHGVMYIVDGENAFEWGGGHVNNLAGTLAIIFMFALCVTSLPPVRRGAYHFFLMAHWCFIPLILIFSIIHATSTVLFLIPGIVSLIAQRVVRNFIVPYYTVVSKCDTPSQAYSKMHVAPAVPPTKEPMFNFHDIFPGMYIRVRVKSLSNMLQSHPFSVMRVHPETRGFSIVVKNVGKGTSTDNMIQDLQTGSLLRVSEPCGAASMDLLSYDRVLLVGGGVGVTPLIAALNYLKTRSVYQEMSVKGQRVRHRVTLVWAVRDVELLELLADELISCINAMSDLDLQINYTGVVNRNHNVFGVLGSKIKYGRPAMEKVLNGFGDPKWFKSLAVFTCGPHALTGGAKKAVSAYAGQYPWMKADVHNETFEM